jgi:5-methylcytosine-specific restriction endonuclease McrA
MFKRTNYTEEEFKNAVETSYSISQVLIKLSLEPTGGNYALFYSRVKKLGIDTSHFTGKGHLKGKTHNWSKSIPLEEILVENSSYFNTHDLKRRLLNNGLLFYSCSECGISDWNGSSLSLHLDHINGERTDNRLENLRLLCPNCHSQTDTYAGKNKGKTATYIERKDKSKISERQRTQPKLSIPNVCCDCGITIDKKSIRCRKCSGFAIVPTKIEWPSLEELTKMVEETSYLAVGKKLGVSDNAIRKHIKKHQAKVAAMGFEPISN